MRRTTFTSAATVAALAAVAVAPAAQAADIAPHHLGDDGQLVCAVKLTGKEDKEIQRFTLDASTALSSALIAVIEEQYSDVPEKGKRLLSDARVRQVVEHVLRGEAPASIDVVHLRSALTLNGYSAFNPAGRAVMMLYLGALVLRDEPARLPQHVLWGGAPGVIYAGDDDAGSDDVVNNLLNWAFSAVPYKGEDLDNLRTGLTASAELGQIDAEASQYNAVIADARHACNAQETVRIEFPGSPRFNKPTPTTPVQTTKAQTTTAQTATVTSVAPSATTTTRAETPKSPATVVPSTTPTTTTVDASPSRAPETTTALATTNATAHSTTSATATAAATATATATVTATATMTATETAVSTVVNTTRVPVPTTVTTPVTTKATTETTMPVVTTTPTATLTTTETTETLDPTTPEDQQERSSEAGKVVGIVFGVLGALGLIVAAVLAFGPAIEVKVTF